MTLSQLLTQMTETELLGWHAYYVVRNEQEKQAMEKAKRRR
jgi:hypothetical protein